MGHQANTATQAITRSDGRLPEVSVAAGRKGFKAENELDAGRTEQPRPAGWDAGGPSGACEGPLRSTSATRHAG